ncbi:MAG: serine/threonine-protein kinase [Caldilineaceae bacterium]
MAHSSYATNTVRQPEKPLNSLGPYQISGMLGQGGVSIVYRARRPNQPEVALKVLNMALSGQPDMRKRFLDEHRLLQQLRHRGIVQVYDAGELDGRFYIALQLLTGDTLEALVTRNKTLGEITAIDIAKQVGETLEYIHQQRLVHRDIKTSNVMITHDRRAVLFDFGTVLRLSSLPAEPITGVFGTPPFVSPEQALASPDIDGRADIYGLGVVLYRMVAGRKPFYGSRSELLHAHIHDEPPPPSHFARVSPQLEQIILKALAKDPADRYQRAIDMVHALDNVEPLPEPAGLSGRLRQWFSFQSS